MVGAQRSIEFGVIRNLLGICQGTNGTKLKDKQRQGPGHAK